MTRTVSLLAALLLTACAVPEAGNLPNQAQFGAPNNNNLLAQAAYLSGDRMIQSMQAKFVAEVPDTVNFEFNRSDLDGEARDILRRQAAWLKANPQVRLRVYGHTDLVGSDGYNNRLGLKRARAAVRFLVAQGVAANRLDAVASLGEREPVVATEGKERRNRRTVTAVAGFTSGFVGDGMDGKRARAVYNAYVGDTGTIESAQPTRLSN